jgi:4-amino-4-deoxy-L-arabinose transferase-like glycosyltransferase
MLIRVVTWLQRHALASVFVVALMARLAVAFTLPESVVWEDGHRYLKVAANLLAGQGFGSLYDNQLSVPTLPVVIAAAIGVFGEDFGALRVVMAVLGASASAVAFALARRVFDARVALLAGLAVAVYPYLVYLSALFEYPQPLFILLIGTFFLLYYQWVDTGARWRLALAGVVLGLAVLTVPTTLIFLAAMPLALIRRELRATVASVLILMIPAVAPLAGWAARNYVAYDRFVLINAAGGYSLWQANNQTYLDYGKAGVVPTCAPGHEEGVFCVEYKRAVARSQALPDDGVSTILEFDRIANEKAWEFILDDPLVTMRLSLRKFAEFWSPIPNAVTKGWAQGGGAAQWVSIFTYTPLLLLGIAGLYLSRMQWRRLLPIYFFGLALAGPYCLFLPTTRYRLPLDYFLALFAAYAVVALWDVVVPRRVRWSAGSGAEPQPGPSA